MDNNLEKTNGSLSVVPQESAFSSPTAFENAQRMARLLSASSLVPKAYQNQENIPNIVIALEMAARVGASPLMVMQNLNVIQGKPGWASAFIIAMINASGKFQGKLKFKISGEGMKRGCIAYTQDIDTGEVLESPEVTMQMAKDEGWIDKAGSKWKTIPELMLRYRAAAFFGRLFIPEIMMGMQTVEEIADTPRSRKAEIDFEDLSRLFEEKKTLIPAEEFANCQRIIDNKEVTSYHKLFILLNSL